MPSSARFKPNADELTTETLNQIQEQFTGEPLPGNTDHVELDLLDIYHDYIGVGLLIKWIYSTPGVSHITIHTDLPLKREETLIEVMCKGLISPEQRKDHPNYRDMVVRELTSRGCSLRILAYTSNGTNATYSVALP